MSGTTRFPRSIAVRVAVRVAVRIAVRVGVDGVELTRHGTVDSPYVTVPWYRTPLYTTTSQKRTTNNHDAFYTFHSFDYYDGTVSKLSGFEKYVPGAGML